MGRVVLGGLLAGVVVFFWGAVSHMAPPIGTMGIHQYPTRMECSLRFEARSPRPVFYFFPGMDHSKPATRSEIEAVFAKIKQGPSGILVIHPEGGDAMSPRQLGTELATNVVSLSWPPGC